MSSVPQWGAALPLPGSMPPELMSPGEVTVPPGMREQSGLERTSGPPPSFCR